MGAPKQRNLDRHPKQTKIGGQYFHRNGQSSKETEGL
jgi:hypothetical protein